MSELQNLKIQLSAIEAELPHGSKSEIADYLEVKYANVVAAFRGMAGKELTKNVLKKAKAIVRKNKKHSAKPVIAFQ